MHRYDAATDELVRSIIDYALARMRMDPPPLDGPRPAEELARVAGTTITDEGIGGDEALRIFRDVLAPANISVDHPRFLAFIPAAPTESAVMFDLVVGASSLIGSTWLESAGAIHAENETLAFLAREAGLPDGAGGAFVQGGTNGNLSALVAARESAAATRDRPNRWAVLAGNEAHSSITSAAKVMDAEVAVVPTPDRKLTAEALEATIASLDAETRDGLFAIAATGGTTNLGLVDDLAGVADVAQRHGLWFHVDAAYGGAALLAPSARHRFDGIERCDSFIVDPHKWLFAPFDSCALIYRNPEGAIAAHAQHAGYLDPIRAGEWNPADVAIHLTRRPRGLPLWFSLSTHGVTAYREAVETTLKLARETASVIDADDRLELFLEPELSVVAFRRIGWNAEQYQAWSDRILQRGLAFVLPSTVDGEPLLRLCFVNPRTTIDDVHLILGSLD